MTDEWVPAFPGQRPPFPKGHTYSTVSGYRSEQRVVPLAAEILERLLSDPATPDYLGDESFRPALEAWARAEARVALLTEYVDTLNMSDVVNGRYAPLETLRKWESSAAGHRARLGLDPTGRARLLRDLSAAQALTGHNEFLEALERTALDALPPGRAPDDV